jgi:hypothetical protein
VSLFLWTIRENFQDTATLRGPPYGDSDYPTIVNLMSPTLVTKLQDKFLAENPSQNKPDKSTFEGQRQLANGLISELMGDFHRNVYQPATTPLTESNVDTYITQKVSNQFLIDNKAEVKKLLIAYFVTQPAGAANAPLSSAQIASNSQATNSGYSAVLAGVGQTESTGNLLGGSSGGSSGGSPSNAGGSGNVKKGNIWGPTYSGMGDNAGFGGESSSSSRNYPTLLGPQPKESKMIEGGGIANVSKQTTLPSSASTGSDPSSQFFGTSRSPGDQDLFPNPYREFTPSSGSSKTEPVPYLADFSAFLN